MEYVTITLSVDYKKFIKLDTIVRTMAEVVRIEGRKVFVKGTVRVC